MAKLAPSEMDCLIEIAPTIWVKGIATPSKVSADGYDIAVNRFDIPLKYQVGISHESISHENDDYINEWHTTVYFGVSADSENVVFAPNDMV